MVLTIPVSISVIEAAVEQSNTDKIGVNNKLEIIQKAYMSSGNDIFGFIEPYLELVSLGSVIPKRGYGKWQL